MSFSSFPLVIGDVWLLLFWQHSLTACECGVKYFDLHSILEQKFSLHLQTTWGDKFYKLFDLYWVPREGPVVQTKSVRY